MTVKPLNLCRHLIRIFSSKGDTVLDPFMGSGTTAVAALAEERQCLGYEVDKEMIATIEARLGDQQNLTNEYLLNAQQIQTTLV